MAESRDGQDIVSRIMFLRSRVERVWRLARATEDVDATKNLKAYAEELDTELQKLETEAAVIKQAASQTDQAAAQSIAAVRPPADPDSGT